MVLEEQQAKAAQADLITAIRNGRDLFGIAAFPGGFANELATAIAAVVDARVAVREREILEHLKVTFDEGG